MKKYIGAICSAAAGILTFILLILNWMTAKISTVANEKSSVSGWDLLKDNSDVKGFTLYKLSAIVMIIVASVLIISAFVLILQNLKVLKFKFNLNLINNIILTVFALFVILAVIGALVMAGEMSASALGVSVKCSVAIGGWLMAIVGIAACVTSWLTSRK